MTDSKAVIACTKGYIIIENVNNPQNIYVYSQERKLLDSYSKNDGIRGYEYQLKSVVKSINNGMIECKDMPHNEILEEMKLVNIITEQNRTEQNRNNIFYYILLFKKVNTFLCIGFFYFKKIQE